MCTLILLRRPDHEWPVIIGANRDEMKSRPFHPPARHWPEFPDIIAGYDVLAKGSWLGINESGVVAGIMNRQNSLGPEKGKRSRGELVIEALNHGDATAAVEALSQINSDAYRSFNLIIADNMDAYWLRHKGDKTPVEVIAIPAGLSFFTAYDRNDDRSPRVRAYLPRFEAANPPNPNKNDWREWQNLLANKLYSTETGPEGAMTVTGPGEFGTVCSSLIALPSIHNRKAPAFLFAHGKPGEARYEAVDFEG